VSVPFRFRAMGCEIVGAGVEVEHAKTLFERFEQTFSRFRLESELSRVNDRAGRVLRVSPLFARALALALELAYETGGLVDPTLGAAIEAAGYDRDLAELRDDPAPPGPSAPGSWRSVRLEGCSLLVPSGVRLDLNGVVKAMAVDEATAAVDGTGYVSAGGDLAVRGPVEASLPAGGRVRVLEGGLATSGTARRRWLRGGVLQHHLIDPASGRPASSPWSAVTVSGSSCVAADAAAKAAFVLGVQGPAWLDARGLPGRFVAVDGCVVANRCWRAVTQELASCT
jgi:thiamine biosynthesis lipoprotein